MVYDVESAPPFTLSPATQVSAAISYYYCAILHLDMSLSRCKGKG
jgi:hypothetical protein